MYYSDIKCMDCCTNATVLYIHRTFNMCYIMKLFAAVLATYAKLSVDTRTFNEKFVQRSLLNNILYFI